MDISLGSVLVAVLFANPDTRPTCPTSGSAPLFGVFAFTYQGERWEAGYRARHGQIEKVWDATPRHIN